MIESHSFNGRTAKLVEFVVSLACSGVIVWAGRVYPRGQKHFDEHNAIEIELKCALTCRRSTTNNVLLLLFSFNLSRWRGTSGRLPVDVEDVTLNSGESPCFDATNRYGWPGAAPAPGPLHLCHNQQVSAAPSSTPPTGLRVQGSGFDQAMLPLQSSELEEIRLIASNS